MTKNELYEQLLTEKDRVILVLSDMVDVLRNQLYTANQQPLVNTQIPRPPHAKMWVGDDEEDILHLVDNEKLDASEARAALEAIGSMNMEDILVS